MAQLERTSKQAASDKEMMKELSVMESHEERFAELGIRLKIISGDNPHTVAALSRQAGFEDVRAVSGLELAEMDETQLEQVAEEATISIWGRMGT